MSEPDGSSATAEMEVERGPLQAALPEGCGAAEALAELVAERAPWPLASTIIREFTAATKAALWTSPVAFESMASKSIPTASVSKVRERRL